MILQKTNHHGSTDVYAFTQDRHLLAVLNCEKGEDNRLKVATDATFLSGKNALKCMQYLDEQLTVLYHPAWIEMERLNPRWHAVLNGCRYYARGKNFLKKVDPWRLKLKDRVFDEYGYIIDQGRMEDIPFGWFSTREKGCGWIAAWNLLKMNGKEMLIDTVVNELSAHAFLGEVMGEDIYKLRRYLNKKGLPAKLSLPLDTDALPKIISSRCGIILYHHAYGAHFCAYRKEEDGRLHFYNAIYGRRYHFDTLEHFMKSYEFLPFTMALYIE